MTPSPAADAAIPSAIEVIGGTLAIRWEDAHESYFDGSLLRSQCPCALCKTNREKAAPADPLNVLSPAESAAAAAVAVGTEAVGRYALRILWSDGHGDGIYDFRMLRSLCPCEECKGT